MVSGVWVVTRREDGARQRHLRHVTTGVTDDRDRSARSLLVRRSGFFKFRPSQGYRHVLDDRSARRPVAYKSGSFAFRARMNGARSAALFDLLRAK